MYKLIQVLLIEDDWDLALILKEFLEGKGYNVTHVENGLEALSILESYKFHLMICDIMMPKMDGLNFIRSIREADIDTPVIFVTAKNQIDDKLNAFLFGGDDYLVKPIQYDELFFRIKAILKRVHIKERQQIRFSETLLDLNSLSLTVSKDTYHLPKKEFELLWLLGSYPHKVFTRQDILENIWGYDSESTERTVDVHVNRLRRKLSQSSIGIKTIHGLGYTLDNE